MPEIMETDESAPFEADIVLPIFVLAFRKRVVLFNASVEGVVVQTSVYDGRIDPLHIQFFDKLRRFECATSHTFGIVRSDFHYDYYEFVDNYF